jgi:hypothetical protein
MSNGQEPELPGAQVTPALSGDADDESPTIDIGRHLRADQRADRRTERWTGSATVPPPGSRRRSGLTRAAHLSRDDDEHTLDLPYDDDPGPSLLERWRARRRRPAAVRPALAAPPSTQPAPRAAQPPRTATRPAHPPVSPRYAQPPGYRQPPGYGHPPGYGPPGYGQPRGYGPPPPPPRRRRRKWPYVMMFFVLAPAACCGGTVLWAKTYVEQYPASIAAEADVPGLTRTSDRSRAKAADELLAAIESEQIDEQSVRLLYTDSRKRATTVAATTRLIVDPGNDLDDRFTKLTARFSLAASEPVDAGPLGGHQRCASGSSGGRTVAVCGWADHGSLAVGVFGGRTVNEAATLLGTIRSAVLKRN